MELLLHPVTLATAEFLQRVRIARNADRCTSQSDSVPLSVCLSDIHICPYE